MTYTNSYTDTSEPSRCDDSSSGVSRAGSTSHYRYFGEVGARERSIRVKITHGTDEGADLL